MFPLLHGVLGRDGAANTGALLLESSGDFLLLESSGDRLLFQGGIAAYLKTTVAEIESVGLADVSNPVIPIGGSGDSDYRIREIGNVLYEPADTGREYKTFYTGYNAGTDTDEKIHYAYSADGQTWTKFASNPVISTRQEDPYVVKNGSTYYMYSEDKATQGADGYIRRWSSADCETWADDGRITGLGADAQSPVVWIEGATWYMLYEPYPDPTPYVISLATSSDGLAWTPDGSNPVFEVTDTNGSWANTGVVSDDIIKVGSTYYMMYHGKPTGLNWMLGVASSADLTTWTDLTTYPIVSMDSSDHDQIAHAQIFDDGQQTFLYYHDGGIDRAGIYRGFPIKES